MKVSGDILTTEFSSHPLIVVVQATTIKFTKLSKMISKSA